MTQKPLLNVIVAVTTDNAIGRNGDLVYRLRGDMRHFRELTMGHPVIMGRLTWESLPSGALPGRRNIVVSRNKDYEAPGAEVVTSLDEATASLNPGEEAFIIGGGRIYEAAMPMADRIYLTVIDAEAPDADTFFPAVYPVTPDSEWTVTTDEPWQTDERSGIRFKFVCLSRK